MEPLGLGLEFFQYSAKTCFRQPSDAFSFFEKLYPSKDGFLICASCAVFNHSIGHGKLTVDVGFGTSSAGNAELDLVPHFYCEDPTFLDLGLATPLSGIQIKEGVPSYPVSNAAMWVFTKRLGRHQSLKLIGAAFLLSCRKVHREIL